ncbi:DNA topoisomerase, partial [Halomonas elongata]|uniref:DNA topoisomerase n=1 Tax=Halomonas elongata TaxID=2746 RepID=UPI00255AB7B0
KQLDRLREAIIKAMQHIMTQWPQDTEEVDASLAAGDDYCAMLAALEADDLPRFEARFKQLLNENTIREIAGFQAFLNQQREDIKGRVATINASLHDIDYNPGRYIRLLAEPSPDAEIRDFEPRPFFVLWVDLAVSRGQLRAWWVPGDTHRLDDQGRLLDRAPAAALADRLPGAEGRLDSLASRDKRQAAPLPYSLSALQVDAARRHGLSAKAVLDVCQRLYERHQLITYPRSDCRYLPEEHFAQAQRTLSGACRNDETLSRWLAGADFSRRSKAWDDKKVGAHHALAPTGKPADLDRLSRQEADVFRLIARNVLAQFYPALQTREVKAEFLIAGERFRARGQEVLEPGWKPLFTTRDEAPPLPPLSEGEACRVEQAGVEDRETRPPEHFTDASLIKAMMNIARYVDDPAIRRTLRDSDGLGTEATRAGIIETLLERGYLVREGKSLKASRLGSALIASLPEAVGRPERTAQWEQRLANIAEQDDAPAPFLEGLIDDLRGLLGHADAGRVRSALSEARGPEPKASKPARGRGRSTKRGSGQRRQGKGTRRAAGGKRQ